MMPWNHEWRRKRNLSHFCGRRIFWRGEVQFRFHFHFLVEFHFRFSSSFIFGLTSIRTRRACPVSVQQLLLQLQTSIRLRIQPTVGVKAVALDKNIWCFNLVLYHRLKNCCGDKLQELWGETERWVANGLRSSMQWRKSSELFSRRIAALLAR